MWSASDPSETLEICLVVDLVDLVDLWGFYGDSMGIQPFKLVGGIPTPLKNDGLMEWVSNSWDDDSHYCIWKLIIQSCSKPPSRESQWGMFFGVIGSREKKSTEMFSLLVIWAKHNDRKQDLLGGWPGWPMGILLGFYRNSIGILWVRQWEGLSHISIYITENKKSLKPPTRHGEK